MYVLADIEWVAGKGGIINPTQLAALRVDEDWQVVSSFFARFRPKDESFHDWKHVAYNGGWPGEYIRARSAYTELEEFQKWITPDDTVCWWFDESKNISEMLFKIILGYDNIQRTIVLSDYVAGYLQNEKTFRGNQYRLAKARGLQMPRIKHDSRNDVEVIRLLLDHVAMPQDILEVAPIPAPEEETREKIQQQPINTGDRFICDEDLLLIHYKECMSINTGHSLRSVVNLKAPLRKGYTPCSCCKAEFVTARKDKNRDIIARSQFNFVFTPRSKVFHKPSCGLFLSAKEILGTNKYQSCIEKGKVPCKCCKPAAEDEVRHFQTSKPQKEKAVPANLKAEEQRAYSRFNQARNERFSKSHDSFSSETEKDDFYTLTQPRFAFWAGKGYNTFHLRHCHKLKGVSHLDGFARYSDAKRAGHIPCKFCKPTPKNDMLVSIPITNKVRESEKIEDIQLLCAERGFEHRIEDDCFFMETPVGKWMWSITDKPIHVKHINKLRDIADGYHDQPRLFLSFLDVFKYIERHDDKLVQSHPCYMQEWENKAAAF